MYAALCFRCRYALYAMYARFVFQRAVYLFSRYAEDDFFKAARSSFRKTGDGYLPTFHFAIFGVHAEQIACEQCSFVSSRSSPYFHNDVFVVFRVGRDEEQLDAFLHFGDMFFSGRHFFARHLLHFRVVFGGQYILGVLQRLQAVHIFFAGFHDIAQVLIFFSQLYVAFLVADYIRVGNQSAHLLVAAYQPLQFV